MKHDAIVEQGIHIHERIPIPDELIPEDSRVEIDAKIHSGYFTTGKTMTSTSFPNDFFPFSIAFGLQDMLQECLHILYFLDMSCNSPLISDG